MKQHGNSIEYKVWHDNKISKDDMNNSNEITINQQSPFNYASPLSFSPVDFVNPRIKEAVEKHKKILSGDFGQMQRICSWQKLIESIKDIYSVYENSNRMDRESRKYLEEFFEPLRREKNINNLKTDQMIKMLSKFSPEEASYILHLYTLTYFDPKLDEWAKYQPV